MSGEKCNYEDIGLMIETTQIAKAGRKYDRGKFKKLPDEYYIMSQGKRGKKVEYSGDYRDVEPFSDKVDVIRPDSDTCKRQSTAKAKEVAKALGLNQSTNFNVRNIEGRKSVVVFPESRVTQYPEFLKKKLDRLKQKGVISDYNCFSKKDGEVCVLW